MEKDKKGKAVPITNKQPGKTSKLKEPAAVYQAPKVFATVKDFNYKDFKKIADKVSFTQQEWSDILHISERTIQRYSKNNGNFSFSVTDRILQIEKIIRKGVSVFGSPDKFIAWLHTNPVILEGTISFQSLASIEGINLVLRQLGRIEHGIFA